MRTFLTAAILALLATPLAAQTPATNPPAARTAPAAAKAAAKPAPPKATVGKVDVNGATADQLDAIPGIGPVRAKAIVGGRPYEELQDLVKKKVLTQGVLDKARSHMALANINTSTAADMEKTLPGVGDVRAKAIVAGRPYAKPEDLVTRNVVTQALYDKMKDVISY